MPRARYNRPLAEYAQVYETTDRAIKRWIRIGKDRGQLPPLDDPRNLVLSWWPFAMTQRAPAKLLAIADRHIQPAESHAAHDSIKSISQEKKCATALADMAAPEILDDLRAKVAFANRAFESAIASDPPDDTKLLRAERLYSNLVELWHKVEVKIQEIKRQAGLSIDRYEVEAQYAADWRTLRDMRDSMPRKILAELERSTSKKMPRILRAIADPLREAIDRVRTGEEQIFRTQA